MDIDLYWHRVAQVKAILSGFEVACVSRVEVDKMNRIRPSEHFAKIGHPPAVLRIIGDHIEGLEQLIALTGSRGGFHDGNRKEIFLGNKSVQHMYFLFC